MTITMPEIDVPKIDEATDQLVADLQTARDLIAVHGLAKEVFVAFGGGYCTVGAIKKVTVGGATMLDTGRSDLACRALADTLGYVGAGGLLLRGSLYDYNDSPFSEQADVLALFDTTIARLSA